MPELLEYRITFLPDQVARPGHPATSSAGWITVLAPDEASVRRLISARVGEDWHLLADAPFDDWSEDYPLGELARWTVDQLDVVNRQMVGARGEFVHVALQPFLPLTPEQALVHAAWLVAMASTIDPQLPPFGDVLEAVKRA
jgi:hypothetical protein